MNITTSMPNTALSRAWPWWANVLLFGLFFLFSLWFMFETFQLTNDGRTMMVARTVHSDFASHIPLIRSFSQGDNWPPEFPLFPGSPIRYHFLFYAAVGVLEAAGVPLDIALNGLSALGMAFMLQMLFLLTRQWLSTPVAVLTVLFFLFNGSLSFLKFFETTPISLQMFDEIWRLQDFISFGPWDGGEISAFWSLNIYSNQRHLAWGYGLVLLFMYACVRIQPGWSRAHAVKAVALGAVLGLLPLLHQPSAMIFAVFGLLYFLILKGKRLFLLTVGATSLVVFALQYPFFLTYLGQGAASVIHWRPGYLITDDFTLPRFLSHWFQNIGLHLVFIPLGLVLMTNRSRLILLPALIVFMLAMMFQFAVEMPANHKLVSFAMLLLQAASAFFLVSMWRYMRKRGNDWPRALRLAPVAASVLLLTLSGVLDLMVVKNDWHVYIPADEHQATVEWIETQTPPDAVFINSSYLYHPASLAGRPIFFGWPYFAWSAGYDVNERQAVLYDFFEGADTARMCALMEQHGLDYATIQEHGDENLPHIDYNQFISQKPPDYAHESMPYAIYSRQTMCS